MTNLLTMVHAVARFKAEIITHLYSPKFMGCVAYTVGDTWRSNADVIYLETYDTHSSALVLVQTLSAATREKPVILVTNIRLAQLS